MRSYINSNMFGAVFLAFLSDLHENFCVNSVLFARRVIK